MGDTRGNPLLRRPKALSGVVSRPTRLAAKSRHPSPEYVLRRCRNRRRSAHLCHQGNGRPPHSSHKAQVTRHKPQVTKAL